MAAKAAPRKAPSYFVKQIVAMEMCLEDMDQPIFVRAFCWYKLVSIWGGLRYSDWLGAPPSQLHLDVTGLTGCLLVTKTTGPNKPVRRICFYV
eukprot:6488722-Amphidinium_carterae.1